MNYRTRHSAIQGVSSLGERLEYRLVVTLAFTLCLVAIVGRRLVGRSGPGEASVFSEAYSAAMAAIGYAYTV